jgi:hypothetical protein
MNRPTFGHSSGEPLVVPDHANPEEVSDELLAERDEWLPVAGKDALNDEGIWDVFLLDDEEEVEPEHGDFPGQRPNDGPS